jgi:hypothetical protein
MNQQIPIKRKNKSLSLVKPIHLSSLDKFKRLSKAEEEIDLELSKLGDLSKLEDDECQLIHLMCNLVENITTCKLKGDEKRDFVVKKIISILPNLANENDIKWITKIINVLCLVGSVKHIAQSKEAINVAKTVCGFFLK